MAEKFQNKYRIPSARLATWDYRWAGAYFITICTENQKHYFGQVKQGAMQLSPLGAIADVLWHQIKIHHRTIELGAYVVMPNHLHGIIILPGLDGNATVEKDSSEKPPLTPKMVAISPKAGSISAIIRSYKAGVSFHAHRLGLEFEWQARFWDNIIRDAEAYQRITQYIINNPMKWPEDKFY